MFLDYRVLYHGRKVQCTVHTHHVKSYHNDGKYEMIPVEWDPSDIVSQHYTWGHEQLGKLTDIQTKLIVSLELYAAVCQQVDRVLCIHVLTAQHTVTTYHSTRLYFLSPKPDTSLHCQTMDMGANASCSMPFMPQLSLVLTAPTMKGWPGWVGQLTRSATNWHRLTNCY